ncbi:hypothetical protein HU47_15095 [Salmonella enterica subsp. enterica serovar Abaetetuba]|uniref:hypothetical protein n=2 Tax=Salmonella enterica TaxID=28901 RepID=UPI0008FCCA4E|nr:hypothetical protein [Salmonella enterica]EAP3745789.1 hypothetical protein [Salmonella enterica subsp. enterica serovar Minnesota]EAP4124684.1 hypothetical protein [Salmonella enterica subsp. enterica serovar Infantis]EAR0342753.1 hypothetical protein [Salmonella enterica subsp. enterica serovar Anatum]EBV5806195.1 hypothetical protein [Salmonella enterica subsp. enterica serovar Abaetetuba]ECI0973932.1 hypothetical protein [Salmonella enterica subsp. diarizonae]EDJ3200968.1 hypothetical 
MKLYIANTTKQRHIFTYRKLETGRLVQIPIEHGAQMMVLDGSTEEVDAVIQHHRVYGLVDSTKIDQSKDFVGLCYSINKPVSAAVIEKTIRDNDVHLTRNAHNLRQASVAALDSALRDSGTGYSGEMEVSAEQAKGREDSEDTPTVNETIVTEKSGSKKK